MDLRNARVIGYFSLPSPSLAEANPTAYNNAMAAAPVGAGTCQHCGTAIIHHVLISTADGLAVIGTTCAEKIGSEMVVRCIRYKETTEQLMVRDALAAKHSEALARSIEERRQKLLERQKQVGDLVERLILLGSEFHRSLAEQFALYPLTTKQANFATKGLIGRETKKNTKAWRAMHRRFQS
jgi:hypothetical protein